MTKKESIQKLWKSSPTLTNKQIAKHTGASLSYVNQLLGNRIIDPMKSHTSRKELDLWAKFKKSQAQFMWNYLPTKRYKAEFDFSNPPDSKLTDDFSTNFYLPTEDQWSTTASGQDFMGSWSQYQFLAERRIGPGVKITRFPAEDAIREGFQILDSKSKKVVPFPELDEWIKNTDFLNELARVIYFERTYGIGFLVAYYSADDKAQGVMSKKLGKGEKTPIAFEALAPTEVSPLNVFESNKLDKNPQKWDLRGGTINPQEINHERVRVFMSRPVVNRWYGLSIFELVWDHIIPYYQAQIFLLRGFAKWGNMVVDYEVDSEDTIDALFDEHQEVIEDMKMNGTLLHKLGTSVGFMNTNLGTGLQDILEIWIEGISSGTGIPVPVLMGRVTSAGLSGAAYLMAERYYWNMVKNIQQAFTDDVTKIIEKAGFDMKGKEINWRLSITKTDQQRLIDEGMQIENEILKEQYVQTQIQTLMMLDAAQNPQVDENPSDNGPNASSGNEDKLPKGANLKKLSEGRQDGIRLKQSKEKEDFLESVARSDFYNGIRTKRLKYIHDYYKKLMEVPK